MLAQRRAVEFEDDMDRPDLRPSLDPLPSVADGRPSFAQSREAASDRVVRPQVFAREGAAPEAAGSRSQALNAMRTIVRAADQHKRASLDSERRAAQASDLARRALQQLETTTSALTSTQAELGDLQDRTQRDKAQADARIVALAAENEDLLERLSKLDHEFNTIGNLYREIKSQLIYAREQLANAEARANEAENDLNCVAEFANEAFKSE